MTPPLKKFPPAILVLAALVTAAQAGEHHRIFLLGGQSNMRGAGKVADLPAGSPLLAPLSAVGIYYDDEQNPPTPHLPRNQWQDLGPYAGAQFGPELAFGHALHAGDPTANFSLIKYSGNGTSVHADWNPDQAGNVYARFRNRVDNALAALPAGDTYEIEAMLWVQGIADGRDGRSAAQYQADLERLIADVRSRYRSDMPFLITRSSINHIAANNPRGGSTVPDHPDYGLSGIRTGQENTAAADPFNFLVDADNFLTDNAHYKAAGQVGLGEALAASYFQNIVPEPATLLTGCTIALLFLRRSRYRACLPKRCRDH